MPACTQPAELLAAGPAGVTVSCKNVLVGEVWLCSGQSNMEWPVSMSNNAEIEITGADYPEIRLFTVPQRLAMEPVASILGLGWVVCSLTTIGSFSAVGYFFGREIYRRLGVPIGFDQFFLRRNARRKLGEPTRSTSGRGGGQPLDGLPTRFASGTAGSAAPASPDESHRSKDRRQSQQRIRPGICQCA